MGKVSTAAVGGHLVNMAYAAEYDKKSIILNNGEYVYMEKEKYGEFIHIISLRTYKKRYWN